MTPCATEIFSVAPVAQVKMRHHWKAPKEKQWRKRATPLLLSTGADSGASLLFP
jgi:hypothetical protein